MRHTIVPGGHIEVPSLEEITGALRAAGGDRDRAQKFRKVRGAMLLNAAGGGQATEDVSPQYDWIMERVTISGAGAVNALVQLFVDETQPSAMVEVIQVGAAGLYSDGFSNCIHVPANSMLYIVTVGGVPNGDVSYNLQVRLVYNP